MHYKDFPAKKKTTKKIPTLLNPIAPAAMEPATKRMRKLRKKRKRKGHFHNKKIRSSGKRKSFVFICFSFLCLTREGKVSRAGGEVADPKEKKFFVLESVPFRLLGEFIVCILFVFFCLQKLLSLLQTNNAVPIFILKKYF